LQNGKARERREEEEEDLVVGAVDSRASN